MLILWGKEIEREREEKKFVCFLICYCFLNKNNEILIINGLINF